MSALSKPKTVLIVDDHHYIIDFFRLAFGTYAKRLDIVGSARNGIEALRLQRELKPDVVVLDLFLPDQNGFDVARQMLSSRPAPRIVFFTAADEPAFAKEALAMGAAGYLMKSGIDTNDLVHAILKVAEGGSAFPSDLIENVFSLANEPGLTARQIEVIRLKAKGFKNYQIAEQLSISRRTVEAALSESFARMDVQNATQAVYVLSKTGVL